MNSKLGNTIATNERPLVSIVTPVFNEFENLPNYEKRVTQLASELEGEVDFEFVFTDNCSSDETFQYLKSWSMRDPRVRAFKFSKNFGYQRSIFTGYRMAKGNAAIELDADLQDPPEMIKEFISKWREGNNIVYGIREKRQEGFIIVGMRKIYYRLLRKLAEEDLPADAGDFMLIDRSILDLLKKIEEPSIYIRGVVFGFGFKRFGIPYQRHARTIGKTKFPFRKMAELAVDGIVGHSMVPLRVASIVGLFIAVITFLISLGYVILRLTVGIEAPLGFTTIVVLILLSASMNAIFLGILGEYVARIFGQTRWRPMTIIAEATSSET